MQYYFRSFEQSASGWRADAWKAMALLAAFLLTMAVTIFIMPEILAFMLATFIMWAGILLAVFAFRLRKMQKQRRYAASHVTWF